MYVTASQAICVPYTHHVARALFTRCAVGVSRKGSGRHSSHQLGVVKLCVAGIGARDVSSAHCMTGALQETSMTQLVVTRIPMEERTENGAGHKVLDGIIGIRRPEPLCVALCPLSVRRITVAGLPQSSDKSNQNKFKRIEYPTRHHLELLTGN